MSAHKFHFAKVFRPKAAVSVPLGRCAQQTLTGGVNDRKGIWDRIAGLIEVIQVAMVLVLYGVLFAGLVVGVYIGARFMLLLLTMFHRVLEVSGQ